MGNNTSKELDSDTLDMTQSETIQRGGNKLEHTIQQLIRNSQENTDKSPHFFTDVDFDSAVEMVQNGGKHIDSDSSFVERRYHNNPNYKKNRNQNLSSVNEYDINLLEKQFGGVGDDDDSPIQSRRPVTHEAIVTRDVKHVDTSRPVTGGSVGQKQLSKNVLSNESETNSQIVRAFKMQQMKGGYHPVSVVSKTVLSDKSETDSQIVRAFKMQQQSKPSKPLIKNLTGGKHSDLAQETSDYGNFSIVESAVLSQTSEASYKNKKGGNKMMGGNSIILSATSDTSIDYSVLKNKQTMLPMDGGGGCGCAKTGDIVPPATKLSHTMNGGSKIFSPKKISSIVSSSSNNPIDYNILVGGKESASDSVSDSSISHPINDNADKSSEMSIEPSDASMSEPDMSMSEPSDSSVSSDTSDSSNNNLSPDDDASDTSSDSSPAPQQGGLSSSAGITSASEIVINSKFLYSDNTFYGSENVSDKYNSFSSMIE